MDVDIVRSAKKLFGQMFIATILIVVGSFLYYKVSPDRFVGLVEFSVFHSQYWFAGYYLSIVFAGSLCLNKFLREANQYSVLVLLTISFTIASSSWTGVFFNILGNGIKYVAIGVFLYAFGAYMNRFGICIPVIFSLIIIVLCYCIVYLSYYNTVAYEIELFLPSEGSSFVQPFLYFNDWSIITVLIAINVFSLCLRIHLQSISIINWAGKAVFMVYLIHGNSFVSMIWRENDWMSLLNESPLLCFIQIQKYACVTFLIGFIAFALYATAARFFEKVSLNPSGK